MDFTKSLALVYFWIETTPNRFLIYSGAHEADIGVVAECYSQDVADVILAALRKAFQ